jgi:outer membrane lipoprotein carrier protein
MDLCVFARRLPIPKRNTGTIKNLFLGIHMKHSLNIILSTALVFTSVASFASGASQPLVELHELLSHTRSLQGDFTQVTTDQQGEVVEENTGTFAIKRPGLLRWHIAEPFEQLLVSNGETLWVYDPDLEQVTINTVDEQMQQNSALLLSSDLEKLQANYEAEEVRTEGNEKVFALLPKDAGNSFERLELQFEGDQLTGWDLYTALGEKSTFTFEDLKVNEPVADELFKFDPPPGVDVLDER